MRLSTAFSLQSRHDGLDNVDEAVGGDLSNWLWPEINNNLHDSS